MSSVHWGYSSWHNREFTRTIGVMGTYELHSRRISSQHRHVLATHRKCGQYLWKSHDLPKNKQIDFISKQPRGGTRFLFADSNRLIWVLTAKQLMKSRWKNLITNKLPHQVRLSTFNNTGFSCHFGDLWSSFSGVRSWESRPDLFLVSAS